MAEVLKWKQARTAEGRSQKTVADGIGTCRSVINWGIKNGLLPKDNPFAGTAPRVSAAGPPPRIGYSDAQAAALLTDARKERGWIRWFPWVLAFTGARIEEVAELRRCDIRQEAGVWIIGLKPSTTRRGKTAHAQRMIPVHPALEAEGLLAYAAAGPSDGSALA